MQGHWDRERVCVCLCLILVTAESDHQSVFFLLQLQEQEPLPPCLVHREPSAVPYTPRPKPNRRPSLTLPPTQPIATVSLRTCCADCVHITEECLKEQELWQEKFTRGARRRRSASLDNNPSDFLCCHEWNASTFAQYSLRP